MATIHDPTQTPGKQRKPSQRNPQHRKKKEAQKRQQRDIKILAEIIRKLSIFEILESPE